MTTEEIQSPVEDTQKNLDLKNPEETQIINDETNDESTDEAAHGDKSPVTEEISDNNEQTQEQEVTPALATEGGREVSHKILYVGGIDKSITEDDLREIFSVDGVAESVKILADKNRPGFNYAFVEYQDEKFAETAFNKLNGSFLNNSQININYAYQSQQAKNDPNSFNIFVGDLSTEVDDELLKKSFSTFKSILQAHVMWDMQSGRSRGYGFVSFADQDDAEAALTTMNGKVIANRAIRLNWASHKQQQQQNGHIFRVYNNHHHHHHHNNHHNVRHHRHHHNNLNNGYQHFPGNNLINNGVIAPQGNPSGLSGVVISGGLPHQAVGGVRNGSISSKPSNISAQSPPNGLPGNVLNGSSPSTPQLGGGIKLLSPQSYDIVLREAPSWQTTVYLGNLARFTTQNDLIPLLQNFGFIVDLRFLSEKNCAFVKYDSHERAALAIVQLNGFIINGRPIKSGWGKDRSNNTNNLQYQGYPPIVYGQGH